MTRFDIDSEMLAFIDSYLEVSGLSTADSVEQQRRNYDVIVQHFAGPRPAKISSRDSSIDSRHGRLRLRHYRRGDGDDSALVLFVHGGGFILGNLDTHDDICAGLCAGSGYDLVSVDYRLSPEFYHPVHLDDVADAFAELAHDNTILVGASAGGTLCAALSHRCRASTLRPAGQVLIYPSLGGDTFDLESYRVNAEAPLLTSADIHYYRGVRCRDNEIPLDDPEFYPLVAQDFSRLPPTVAISADIDPLRDDARLYVEKLTAAGVDAQWINETGLVHDYLRARHVSSAAGAAFDRICEAIKRLAKK